MQRQLSTPVKEKKTPVITPCHVGTPTSSMRRALVKPLGEHNRSRSFSPALGSLSAKDKRTPARNYSPALDSLSKRTPVRNPKTMLPGVDLTRRFADTEHGVCASRSPRASPSFNRIHEGTSSSLGRKGLATASMSRLRGVATPAATLSPSDFSNGYHSDVTPSPLPCTPGRKPKTMLTGVDLTRRFADTMHDSCSSRTPRGSPSLTRVQDNCSSSLSRKGLATTSKSRLRGVSTPAATPTPSELPKETHSDFTPSPLPCTSPEVHNRGFTELNWEDDLPHEWFNAREMPCFEPLKGSKTPEAQPSKSPELSKRAMADPATTTTTTTTDIGPSPQQTPSPQPTSSPEFLKRGSVPPSSGGCFGAGPLMGPEGMRSVKDRRKCKPRGILTIEGEFLFSSGSADFEEIQIEETISVPALASVEWMVAEGDDGRESSDAESLSPGSFLEDEANVPELRTLQQEASFASFLEDSAGVPGHRSLLQEAWFVIDKEMILQN